MIINAVEIAALALCAVRSAVYAAYEIKNGNKTGGASIVVLLCAAVFLFAYL